MADPTDRASPISTPIGRRRAIAVIASSVAGLVLVDACGPSATPAARGWLPAEIDPSTLRPDQPVPVHFSGTVGGASVAGSAWLVRRASGDLLAFDPRCPHALCAYELTDDARFSCLCHEAFFRLDGSVISGPPPRPLDAWAVREADGRIELEVPGDFSTPRPDD
jgi:nitrite reductase/ring-hydroxylating ferredoxin subunit